MDQAPRDPRIAKIQPVVFEMLFVTGAPRSGTTFVSDWITESPDAYCAHEILDELLDKSEDDVIEYLRYCAATGVDRLSKQLQREFMRWDNPKTKVSPKILGFKEPLVWAAGKSQAPYPVGSFLSNFDTRYIVTIRHPYDVIASGKHRAIHTRNWPNFTVEEHCQLWCNAVILYEYYVQQGYKTLCIKWEKLMLNFNEVRATLEHFLDIELPEFYGYEQTQEYIREVQKGVLLSEGIKKGEKRELLSKSDRDLIRSMVADHCDHLGYQL